MELYTRAIGTIPIPKGPYVLLVDDEPRSVEPLNELVRLSGFQSVATRSAADALACCFHRRPAVLVTDLVMPGPDGRALARRVHRRHPNTAILLVTGQNLDHPEWTIPCELFTAIFAKPLDIGRFMTTLADLMNRKVATRVASADLDRIPRRR